MSNIYASIRLFFLPIVFLCGLFATPSYALVFPFPSKDVEVVGELQEVQTRAGDTFEKLAQRYDVGFHELAESNPRINPFKAMSKGVKILIPSQFILPPGPKSGVVVNLAELRLYHYLPENGTVATYPVGVGKVNWATPLTKTYVVRKQKDPDWHVPASIARAAREKGVELPDVVPAGPENPLGGYAIYLGIRGYLIHGTTVPEGVGKRVSHGCIRMFPEDIEELFYRVPKGTKVRIIHQHAHAGWVGNQLFLEVHKPLKEHTRSKQAMQREVTEIVYNAAGKYWKQVDWDAVKRTIRRARGVPVQIANL